MFSNLDQHHPAPFLLHTIYGLSIEGEHDEYLKVEHESEGIVIRGQPLVEIGNPRTLEVAVDVLSADAVRILPGMPVRFERWGGVGVLQGRVRVVEPVGFTKMSALGVDEQRVWVISDITSDPRTWSRLGDGYRVEAEFILWKEDNGLKVPASALFRQGKDWAVFAVERGKARLRPVTLGHRNGLSAQLLGGAREGETVIVHPDETIHHGVTVSTR
jgi:HlyD family secretion protein